VLRNPWILAQSRDIEQGRAPRQITLADRGQFLLDYIDLLMHERVHDAGPRSLASLNTPSLHHAITPSRHHPVPPSLSHSRWVVNKLRALASWYTKGLDNGSHLRTAINSAESLDELREHIGTFFAAEAFTV
jgi:tRNA-dihydrouridine synthase